jgi:dolichol kinase
MTQPLALEGQDLALELYALLRDLDPATWRDDLEQVARRRLDQISARLDELVAEMPSADAHIGKLRALLAQLSALIDEYTPNPDLTAAELRAQWQALRARLQPGYEELAAALREYALHVPSLRPTNYARNVLHVSSGLLGVVVIQHVLTGDRMVWVATALAIFAWGLELSRRRSEAVNRLCMKVLGKVAHPHEAKRVNSSTWYCTALMGLAWTFDPLLASLAVIVLGVADPAAAIIGRRYGRVRFSNGRSLEGSLAFVGFGAVGALGVLAVYYPDVSFGVAVGLSVVGALAGAIAEQVSRTLDDNLSIPLSVAAGAGLLAFLIGL